MCIRDRYLLKHKNPSVTVNEFDVDISEDGLIIYESCINYILLIVMIRIFIKLPVVKIKKHKRNTKTDYICLILLH